jgi:hypothetical protein
MKLSSYRKFTFSFKNYQIVKILARIFSFVVAAIFLVFLFNRYWYFRNSDELLFNKEYSIEVKKIIQNRGVMVINDTILIYDAVNYDLAPAQLVSYLEESDSLYKPTGSDTIYLKKEGEILRFSLLRTE